MKDTGLVPYDAMCHAIASAHDIYVVKDVRDKALALEHYAALAQNMDAESKAREIRLRAERRAGEMLEKTGRAPAGAARNPNGRAGKEPTDQHEPQVSEYSQAKTDAGISDSQAKRWQKLAGVPSREFEEALGNRDVKPSTSGIIRKANGGLGVIHKVNGSTERMNPDALWLWGRIADLEKRNVLNGDVNMLCGEMTHTMIGDIVRVLPNAISFLIELEEKARASHKKAN